MPTNLLLLPLLGGYWFLHTFYYTRFRSQRLDGYRLLLESALVGVVLAALGWVVIRVVSIAPRALAFWKNVAPAAPNLESHDTFLSITPVLSGYRDKDDLDLVLTVDCLKVYEREHLDPEDFNVTIPLSSVRMASLFDQTVYPAFLVESRVPEEPEGQFPAPPTAN